MAATDLELDPRYYQTPERAAERLGIDVDQVCRLVDDGRLYARCIDGGLAIPLHVMQAYRMHHAETGSWMSPQQVWELWLHRLMVGKALGDIPKARALFDHQVAGWREAGWLVDPPTSIASWMITYETGDLDALCAAALARTPLGVDMRQTTIFRGFTNEHERAGLHQAFQEWRQTMRAEAGASTRP